MTRELLKGKSKEEIFDFIRKQLKFEGNIESQLRYIDKEVFKKEHRRFEMSGDEDSIKHNLAIVNEFVYLGIYDYTDYLYLNFHKGSGTLHMQYLSDNKPLKFELGGYGTVEIIYKIFEETIFSSSPTKRSI